MFSIRGHEYKKELYDDQITTEYAIKLEKLKEGEKISLLSDSMMKAMFQNENRIQYSCLLFSYILDISYEELLKSLKLGKNELDKTVENKKNERCDYVAYLNDMALNLEINNNSSKETLERNMEYAYRLYAKYNKRGRKSTYTNVCQINVNNFAFKESDKTIDIFYTQNEDGVLLHKKIIIVNIYVPNIRKKWYNKGVEELSELERYILTLTEPNIEKSLNLGRGYQVMEEYIKEAENVSYDESLGEAYDKEWALKDQGIREGYNSGFEDGISKGYENGVSDGFETGRIENQKQTVKRMLAKGMNIQSIIEITELTKEQIEDIQNEK